MNLKKKMLTESDIRIIESQSKKNLSDGIHEADNASAGHPNGAGYPSKPADRV